MADDADSLDDWLLKGAEDPREVAARYDAWARRYDADLGAWSYQAPAVVAQTVVTRRPDATAVLDVGCGTGLVGQALRAEGYAGALTGLDISEESLAIARETGAYAALEPADLQQPLPVGDGGADAVVCVGVMTYLPDVEATWRELTRATRGGGLVVVTQREDLWESRRCQAVVDRLVGEGLWGAVEVSDPAPYMPEADNDLAGLGCRYLVAEVAAR